MSNASCSTYTSLLKRRDVSVPLRLRRALPLCLRRREIVSKRPRTTMTDHSPSSSKSSLTSLSLRYTPLSSSEPSPTPPAAGLLLPACYSSSLCSTSSLSPKRRGFAFGFGLGSGQDIGFAMGGKVRLFHTTAATHAASSRSKPKKNGRPKSKSKKNDFNPKRDSKSKTKAQSNPKTKTQPTSSRRLARPEAVSPSSSADYGTQRKERDIHTKSKTAPPVSSPSVTEREPTLGSSSRSRRGRRGRRGGRRGGEEEVETRPSFERDAAPHPVNVLDHGSQGAPRFKREEKRDEEEERARERAREVRDRYRERERERARDGREAIPVRGAGPGTPQNVLHRLRDSRTVFGERRDREDRTREKEKERERSDDTTEEFYHPKRLAEGGVGLSVSGSVAGAASASAPSSTGKAGSKVGPEVSEEEVSGRKKGPSPMATTFTSPPLLPGFVHALEDMFGASPSQSSDGKMAKARPTAIQALSLKWIGDWVWNVFSGGDGSQDGDKSKVDNWDVSATATTARSPTARTPTAPPGGWRQFLLAAETGSGKSIAYLLPMLQGLKMSEGSFISSLDSQSQTKKKTKTPTYAPRGIVLAPTHELARQLTGFAKELVHYPDVKLKVVCASRDNALGRQRQRQKVVYDTETPDGKQAQGKGGRGADVLVGTPTKILEMVRGRGWDRIHDYGHRHSSDLQNSEDRTRGRDRVAQFGLGSSLPESERDLALRDVEWVVIDEADVLFDPDFEATTRQLLADISAARGLQVPLPPFDQLSSLPAPSSQSASPSTPLTYPFHLLLASATIPTSLNTYLNHVHPHILRLASPGLHKLPNKLGVEYVRWSGGNKEKDVWKRVREVWRDDWVEAASASAPAHVLHGDGNGKKVKEKKPVELSQIVIFCNKSSKAEELGAFLSEQISSSSQLKDEIVTGTANANEAVLVITGGKGSIGRAMGNNSHLESFLRVRASKGRPSSPSSSNEHPHTEMGKDKANKPLILITTSLLSRGLDFAPSVKHVFLLDRPRNKVDFLHRAGRAGRAGMSGRVVVFGRAGEELGKEVGGMRR